MLNTQNIYIMLKWLSIHFCQQNKIKNHLKLFSWHKFITTCRDKNVIHDSTMQKKGGVEEKNYMMMWHIIPHHINLGPCISIS